MKTMRIERDHEIDEQRQTADEIEGDLGGSVPEPACDYAFYLVSELPSYRMPRVAISRRVFGVTTFQE